jgi:predicted alpha/beta hydrolase family esterase
MAARYWRLLFLGELGLATALAMLLAASCSLSFMMTALAELVAVLILPGAMVGISFIAARVATGAAQRPPVDCGKALHTWITESVACERATLAMIMEPRQRDPWDRLFEVRGAGGPVLLIHGVVCNRAVWRSWASALRAREFGPIRAINLEPLHADIDVHARKVANELRALRRDCNGARVAIVAHSMGGLVARAALRLAGPDDISQVVTLGSPHHGTALARVLPGRPYEQMRTDSEWLAALNAAQEGRLPVPFTCIYSINDNLIAPARSAVLGGANRLELRGLGHLSLLSAPEAIEGALAALQAADVEQEPCLT